MLKKRTWIKGFWDRELDINYRIEYCIYFLFGIIPVWFKKEYLY